jgi:hypothetical protein
MQDCSIELNGPMPSTIVSLCRRVAERPLAILQQQVAGQGSGWPFSFNARNTKWDLLCRIPGIL